MNLRSLLPFALLLALSGAAQAGASTVLGGALGGAAGAAVGESVGGRDGAIIGGALGGSVGAAIGHDSDYGGVRYERDDYRRRADERYRYDDDEGYRGRGYFCPPGQAKKGRC